MIMIIVLIIIIRQDTCNTLLYWHGYTNERTYTHPPTHALLQTKEKKIRNQRRQKLTVKNDETKLISPTTQLSYAGEMKINKEMMAIRI